MLRYALTALLGLAIAGCGHDDGHDHDEDGCHSHDDHDHDHAAKHGGHLHELGDHEGFLEVKVDHKAGTCEVWVYLGEEMTDASLKDAPVLNLKTKDGPKQLEATGSGAHWTFTDAALKDEPESARFVIAVGGKTYNTALDHDHDHEHDDDEGHAEDHDEHEDHDEDEGHGEDHDAHDKDG